LTEKAVVVDGYTGVESPNVKTIASPDPAAFTTAAVFQSFAVTPEPKDNVGAEAGSVQRSRTTTQTTVRFELWNPKLPAGNRT
jgi:hypothetical protein